MGVVGSKPPPIPAVLRGRTASPKGGTFVTTKCLPLKKGVALVLRPAVVRGRGI